MSHRKKHRISTRPPKTTARKTRVSWWFVSIPIAGLLLVAVTSILFKRRHGESFQAKPGSNTPVAVAKEVPGVSATPEDTVKTNEAEADDIGKATELVNRGTELLAQGKIDEAVAEYKEAARLSPEDEDMHYNLALALARQGQRKAAKAEYLEALRIYPDYTEAHNNLGNLLVAEGKFDDAITHFKDALKISSDNASAHNNLGNALARQGKFTDAILSFREALRLSPDYLEARYNLASTYLAQKRIDEAISELTEILQHHPNFAPA